MNLLRQDYLDILDAIETKIAVLSPHALCEDDHREIERFKTLADRIRRHDPRR